MVVPWILVSEWRRGPIVLTMCAHSAITCTITHSRQDLILHNTQSLHETYVAGGETSNATQLKSKYTYSILCTCMQSCTRRVGPKCIKTKYEYMRIHTAHKHPKREASIPWGHRLVLRTSISWYSLWYVCEYIQCQFHTPHSSLHHTAAAGVS